MAKILFKDGKIQFDATGKILFTKAGDDPDDCDCCGDDPSDAPCTDCDPGGSGSAPSNAVVTNIVEGAGCGPAACSDGNGTASYVTFNDETDYCEWVWGGWGGPEGSGQGIRLRVYKNAATWNYNGCSESMSSGEWAIAMEVRDDFDAAEYWQEKTTGFACPGGGGKVSGAHTFGSQCSSALDCCSGNPTVTVAA
jgi:hypothetical protein